MKTITVALSSSLSLQEISQTRTLARRVPHTKGATEFLSLRPSNHQTLGAAAVSGRAYMNSQKNGNYVKSVRKDS